MDEVTAELAAALPGFDDGRVEVRRREGFVQRGPAPGVIEWMPLLHAGEAGETVLIKVVGYHPQNPAHHGVPTIMGTIYLYEGDTGRLLVIADCALLTSIRTGAASAVASRILARPDSKVLGLVGCGAQAVTQLHALARLFRLERVYVHDVDEAAADSFLVRARFLELDIRKAPLALVEAEADILCTATSVAVGQGPVIRGDALKRWVHINAIGSDLPGKTEIPQAVLLQSFVCPDYLPQAIVEGECQLLTGAQIGPTLTELARDPERYAHFRDTRTVFDSTGFAFEDKVALDVLLRHARRLGIGRHVDVESHPGDAKDPYALVRQG